MQQNGIMMPATRAGAIRGWTIVAIVALVVGGIVLIVGTLMLLVAFFDGFDALVRAVITLSVGFLIFVLAIVGTSVRISLYGAERREVEGALANSGYGQVDVRRLFGKQAVVSSSGHWLRLRRERNDRGAWLIVDATPAGPGPAGPGPAGPGSFQY
ncbi:hypothetical protein [Herbiconiux liukaitaii]|uniref:hypothetical protein n=1 Tax=Herbiconiux liukaitaii TaxID=3342799 RepID=UPI0035B7B566